jgi:hypothetical protein
MSSDETVGDETEPAGASMTVAIERVNGFEKHLWTLR